MRGVTPEHKPVRKQGRHGIRFRAAPGDGLARPRGLPLQGTRAPQLLSWCASAELSYITYHAGLTHFLFAHIVAEVCDASALVVIALGLSKRVAPVVTGALQNR